MIPVFYRCKSEPLQPEVGSMRPERNQRVSATNQSCSRLTNEPEDLSGAPERRGGQHGNLSLTDAHILTL